MCDVGGFRVKTILTSSEPHKRVTNWNAGSVLLTLALAVKAAGMVSKRSVSEWLVSYKLVLYVNLALQPAVLQHLSPFPTFYHLTSSVILNPSVISPLSPPTHPSPH